MKEDCAEIFELIQIMICFVSTLNRKLYLKLRHSHNIESVHCICMRSRDDSCMFLNITVALGQDLWDIVTIKVQNNIVCCVML